MSSGVSVGMGKGHVDVFGSLSEREQTTNNEMRVEFNSQHRDAADAYTAEIRA